MVIEKVPGYNEKETYVNTSLENKKLIDAEAEAGESINIQDVETKLFWEFGIFTSRDRESIESYYTRFATIVMQANILDNVSYHTLFDILKQHQNEVNEIYAERIARNANPLTLVAATQNYPDDYCKAHLTPKPFKPHTPSQHQPDQMLLPSTKNEDTSPTTRNDRNTKQFGNQRTVAVVGNKKTVGNQEVLHATNDNSGPTYDAEPLEKVHTDDDYNVFAIERHHSEQPESINNIYVVEKVDGNIIPDLTDMCDNERKDDQNAEELEDEHGNNLLKGNRGYDLYTIALQESSSPSPTSFMAKASPTQACLWHRRLSHLNFDTIKLLSKNDIVKGLPKLKYIKDQLCSSCKIGKAKRSTFKTKTAPSSKGQLHLLHMDLCGPMWVESINGKKYILVIIDDYSRYKWTHFLRSKDETLEVLIYVLKMIQ
ncbi:retrovirus-related pol polyprotein from transposon TNT 1-94 [Tanacetum coccineum]